MRYVAVIALTLFVALAVVSFVGSITQELVRSLP